MSWKWTWARAQLTAVVASALVWLVVLALFPLAFAGAIAAAVGVAGWTSRPGLWWRFGARRMTVADRDLVLAALVPVQALRGRGQPELLVSRRPGPAIVAVGRRLVVGAALVDRLRRGEISDERFCGLAARALGLGPVHRSRLVAAAELFTLPWSVLAAIVQPAAHRARRLPLATASWHGRWLFLGLAVVDLVQRGLWVSVAMLVLVGIATVTTPCWNRAWAACQTSLAETEAERHGFGARPPAVSTSPVGPLATHTPWNAGGRR